MTSHKGRMDLRAVGIDQDSNGAEIDLRLAHLEWLEREGNLLTMIQISALELEDQLDSLTPEEVIRRRSIIEQAKASGMRLGDGTLSTPFAHWYESFCAYDGNRVIHYSPAAIERGDHPHADEMGGADQLLTDDTLTLTEEAPTPASMTGGGRLGRRMAHTKVIDDVTDEILRSNPSITLDDAWSRFFQIAPNWADFIATDDDIPPVDFEQFRPRHGDPYLKLRSRTSRYDDLSRDFNKEAFKQRLRGRRRAAASAASAHLS